MRGYWREKKEWGMMQFYYNFRKQNTQKKTLVQEHGSLQKNEEEKGEEEEQKKMIILLLALGNRDSRSQEFTGQLLQHKWRNPGSLRVSKNKVENNKDV